MTGPETERDRRRVKEDAQTLLLGFALGVGLTVAGFVYEPYITRWMLILAFSAHNGHPPYFPCVPWE